MRIELSKENLQKLNDGYMAVMLIDGQLVEIYVENEELDFL